MHFPSVQNNSAVPNSTKEPVDCSKYFKITSCALGLILLLGGNSHFVGCI